MTNGIMVWLESCLMFEDKKKNREMDEYNEYSSMFYYFSLKKVSNQIPLTNCLFYFSVQVSIGKPAQFTRKRYCYYSI